MKTAAYTTLERVTGRLQPSSRPPEPHAVQSGFEQLHRTAPDCTGPGSHDILTKFTTRGQLAACAVGTVDNVSRARTSLDDLTPVELGRLRTRMARQVSPEPTSGCHLWTGALNTDGYGHLSVVQRGGRPRCGLAHRVAWMLERGPLQPGQVLDHAWCGEKSCCNPAHLEAVSPAENRRRQAAKGGRR